MPRDLYAFDNEEDPKRLKRFAREHLVVPRMAKTKYSLPERGDVVLRGYLAVPVEKIPAAVKEWDENLEQFIIKPGKGEAVIFKLKDDSSSESESGDSECFIPQTEDGEAVLLDIFNFSGQDVGIDRVDSDTDHLCNDPVVFVTEESLTGQLIITEIVRGLECGSEGSHDSSIEPDCLIVITNLEFDEVSCEWDITRKKICGNFTIEDV